jgi:hypothetical protein
LQSFTKALYEAATAVKTGGKIIGGAGALGGLGDVPDRRPGQTKTPGEKTKGFGRLSEAEAEIAQRQLQEQQARRDRVAELRKQNPGMTASEALERARKESAMPPPPTPTPAPVGGVKGALGRAGNFISSPKGMGIGLVAGIGADFLAEALGRETTGGKIADTAGSALGMAGTGAMIGSMIAPGVGTAVGAALGGIVGTVSGLWKNFFSEEAGSISKVVKEDKETAEEKALKDQKTLIEQNQRIIEEMRGMREETAYGNQIAGRGVGYQADSNRKLTDLRNAQP